MSSSHSMSLQPVKFTIEVGGDWFPWYYLTLDQPIHAIMFEDGRIMDTVNGMRWQTVPDYEL